MKINKKILIIIVILLMILALAGTIYTFTSNKKNDESIGSKLANVKLAYKENDNLVVSEIKNNNENIKVTKQDIDYFKILNPDSQNIEEDAIRDKIFCLEAKNRKIELSENDKKEIENIINSKEVIEGISDKKETENIQHIIYEYLENIEYSSKLRDQILNEIKEYKLSIKDVELEQMLNEYREMQEQAKSVTSKDEKEELLRKIYQQLVEIQNLYYLKIQDNYLIK